MVYFTLFLIAGTLSFLELSFLPYFRLFQAGPFLLLPFLVLLSTRYRGYSHLLVALIFGLIFDFASGSNFGIYTLIFLLTILFGRLFFYREASYGEIQPYLYLLLISSACVYASELTILFRENFVGWQSYLIITLTGLFLTLIAGLIFYRFFGRYLDWLNKKNEERNR